MPERPDRWARLSWLYGGLVACTVGYGLLGIPIQVTDSYGNLLSASQGSLGSLLHSQFIQQAYLRPFLLTHIRLVYDAADGALFAWFRGWHVLQVALLVVLFLRLARPRTVADAAVVPLGLAALVGIHTFTGTVVEAFPINTFMTIVLCTLAAADLALGVPRWWKDVLAAVLLVFAALTVESGLLVAVVLVSGRLAGARGVSTAGVLAQVALFAGYFLLRFTVLDVGTPGLEERSSGFGFSSLDPPELIARFGANPLPFYAYNVITSAVSVLVSEPRAGEFGLTSRVLSGEPILAPAINVASSILGTGVIALFVWQRRDGWSRWRLERGDQIVFVFFSVLAANAALSYAYTKDVILSPAGALYAVALTAAAGPVIAASSRESWARRTGAGLLLVCLSAGWAFRAVGVHVAMRHAGESQRNEWAYADQWLEREGQVPRGPSAIALKEYLQDDAIRRHPARASLTADWVQWFER